MTMTATTGKVTREKVFQKHKWLTERNRDMVTHNDLDGILTAMILNHVLDWKLVGVYDLVTLQFTSSFTGNIRDPIYVDLDVTHKSFKSLGHHILGEDEGDHLNINRLFGVGHQQYRKKYPLSTAVFLFWLFDLDFKELPTLAKLFLLHSDSAWINYHGYKNKNKYTQNVTEWFNRLEMDEAFHFMQHPGLVTSIEKYIFPNTYSYNKQCTYIARNGKLVFRDSNYNVQKYVDNLCKAFKFKPLHMPTNLVERGRFKRKEFDVVDRSLAKTIHIAKQEHSVFSYSMKYSDKIDISYV